ncbi:hypothetical protein [uncultured Modestobacter sp.]|uniref:hypothetical protein n=1 Tax=uncultured Modestobacter sp. TaxID=380048 RepID=UPI0026118099|nr:hypothetical protein [uncultured Modestobacter sp.]
MTAPGPAAGAWSGAVRSEWVKLRSLRSTVTAYAAIAAVLAALCGLCLTLPGGGTEDPVFAALLLAELLVAGVAVLAAAGEFSAGTARSTFTAVPRRTPVLVGKLLAHGGALLAVLAVAAVAGGTAAAIGAPEAAGSPLDPLVLRAVGGTALTLLGVVVLGVSAGLLTRSPAGGLAAVFALVVLPVVVVTAPEVTAYLPGRAAQGLVFTGAPPEAHLLPGAAAAAVLVAWAVVAAMAAATVLRRRDV